MVAAKAKIAHCHVLPGFYLRDQIPTFLTIQRLVQMQQNQEEKVLIATSYTKAFFLLH